MAVLEAWNGQAGLIAGGVSTATLLQTTVGSSPNCWQGATITFDAGTATVALRNQSAVVSSNTLTTATMVGGGFPASPTPGDTFVVRPTAQTSTSYTLTGDIGGGANAAVVFARSQTSQIKTQKWNPGDVVTENWCKVGADSSVIFNVHLLSGPVTSFQVFPASLNLVAAINGTNFLILMPVFAQAIVVINGDWKNRINLAVGPSGIAPAGGAITFDGTQSSVADGSTLVFQPGVQNIPGANKRFTLGNNVTAFFSPGCYTIGTFDGRSKSGWSVGVGYGNLSGQGVGGGASVTQGLPFSQGILYSMILGAAPGGPPTEGQTFSNSVSGLTIVDPCYYFIQAGDSTLTDAMLLSDWFGGMGGVGLSLDYHTGNAVWQRCLSVNADDHCQTQFNGGSISVANVAFLHLVQSVFRLSYRPNQTPPFPAGAFHVYDACWAASISLKDQSSWANPIATCPIIGVLLAGDVGQETWTVANRAVTNLIVEGNILCELFEIRNGAYPWPNSPPGSGGAGSSKGQALNLNFLSLSVTGTQGKRSSIIGLDSTNTPHDLTFTNITIGGVQLTPNNWSTYVDQNSFPYNIRLDGQLVGVALTDAALLWQATRDAYSAAGLVTLTNITARSETSINDDAGTSAAQHVIDLWEIHAQTPFDILSTTHVAVGTQAVIAVLWRRGGSATQIEQVKWETVFGDDGLIGKVRKTGPRAHGVPAISGNTKSKREGTLQGGPILPWSDPGSLPVNFPPMVVPFDDVES
jgi:hypothetical protein